MTNKENNTPGPLEMRILEVLWEKGPANAKTVRDEIAKDRELAYSTVLTVMRRMKAKGMLRRKKVSRSHEYEALKDRTAFKKASVRDLLVRFFSGSPSELILHLVKDQKISEKELSKIEDLLANGKGKKKR